MSRIYDQLGPSPGANDSNDAGGFAGLEPPEAEAPGGGFGGGINIACLATLSKTPELKTGKKGTAYVAASAKPIGTPRECPKFWSLLAYDEAARKQLLAVSVKDTIELHGRVLSISPWTRDSGELEVGVSIAVTRVDPVEIRLVRRDAPSSVGPAASMRDIPPPPDDEMPGYLRQ
jgi:hypothetical protein